MYSTNVMHVLYNVHDHECHDLARHLIFISFGEIFMLLVLNTICHEPILCCDILENRACSLKVRNPQHR